jgi:hypothetical protein
MNNFKITQTTINKNPFESQEVNAVRWSVDSIARGATVANCNVALLKIDEDDAVQEVYFFTILIPENILNAWLDDSVIDDFICQSSNGLFVKE